MKRFRFSILLALAALALVASSVDASSTTLFVRRAMVSNVVRGGTLYAPVTELLSAMGFTWTQSGDSVVLQSGKGGGPEIRSRSFTLSLDSRSFTPETLFLNGKIYVAVKPVAEALGGIYINSPSAGMAQVVFTSASQTDLSRAVKEAERRPAPAGTAAAPLPLSGEGTSAPPAADAKTGDAKTGDAKTGDAKTGDAKTPETADAKSSDATTADARSDEEDAETKAINEKRKNPIKSTVDYTNNYVPNTITEIRGTARVENVADLPVKGLSFVVGAFTRDGQQLGTYAERKYVAEIAPGATLTFDFLWQNYNYQDNIVPKVTDIKFDPLPEKEAPKKKADAKPDASSGTPADTKASPTTESGK
ncbi:MAG: hypothetical protein FJX76_14505 [Armatimonadetes bacterium]|nr:hypothetical protein [Armatimonadota bacterium]